MFARLDHLAVPDARPDEQTQPRSRGTLAKMVRAAVVIKTVSADSLRKTGIFADKAGDFRRFPPEDRRTGSPETKSNARKAGISGPFSRFLGSLAESTNGWLATQW
jgi:hypothetical protein